MTKGINKYQLVTSHTTTTSQVTTSVSKKLKTSWKSPQIIVIVMLFIFGTTFAEWLMHRQASQRPVVNASTDAMPSATSSTPIPRAHYTPFVNSLGMKFAPVHGTDVLFSIWDTRVGDYKAFVDATGRAWRPPDFMQTSDHPAVNVSWEDANAFCEWLSKKEGRIYRLPTDAEWSLAVGLESEIGAFPSEKDGKIKNVYPWVGAWPPPKGAGNYAHSVLSDDFEKTSPVGSFAENRYGLFDMSGNVWQWCEDWYDRAHHKRVLRGGAWNSCLSTMLLCSFRYYSLPDDQCNNVGFRCVTPAKDTEKQ